MRLFICLAKNYLYNVDPSASEHDIADLASNLYKEILGMRIAYGVKDFNEHEVCVHLMGEASLVFCLGSYLLDREYKVVCSTTERVSVETQLPDGTTKKENIFRFVQFREFVKPG